MKIRIKTKQPKVKMEVVRYQVYLHLDKGYSVKIRVCRTVSNGVALEEQLKVLYPKRRSTMKLLRKLKLIMDLAFC